MPNEPQILNFGEVSKRIRAYQDKLASETEKEAADSTTKMVPETDPSCVGDRTIPKDPAKTNANDRLPKDQVNPIGGDQDNNLEHRDTHPHGTGKNRVSTQDGDAKDEKVNSPTDPLSKIAARASEIASRLKNDGFVPSNSSNNHNKRAEQNATNTELARQMYPDPEFLFKLAATIIDTEGGMEAVEPVLRKAAGVEAAQEILTKAAQAYDDFVQTGYEDLEMEKLAAQQQNEAEYVLYEMTKNASETEKDEIVKIAAVLNEGVAKYEDDFLKEAFMQGAADSAMMDDTMAAGEEAAIPGGDGPASPEELIAILDAMVQSGEIDEETAVAVLEQIAGGGGEEMAMPEGGGEEMAMPEGGGEEMVVEASVKQASSLINALVK